MKSKVECQMTCCDNHILIEMDWDEMVEAYRGEYYKDCPYCKEKGVEIYPIEVDFPSGKRTMKDLMTMGF